MPDLSMFIPITKVDAMQRLVYGVATAEVEDRVGEICDYDSTKLHYRKWSDEIAQSTNGKSLGNLRAMHGPVAAGKVTAITFNDEAKQIEICAKVVDDTEWEKVREGIYTGFSQGGTYARRWTDEAGLSRYTAVPNEISLVDLPCLPQARFEMIKADGSKEWRRFGHWPEGDAELASVIAELNRLLAVREPNGRDEPMDPHVADELRTLVERAQTVLETIAPVERAAVRRTIGATHADRADVHPARIDPRLTKSDSCPHSIVHSAVERPQDMPEEGDGARGLRKLALGELEKRFDSIVVLIGDVLERVKRIEEQPLPLPLAGPSRAIAKHEDNGKAGSGGESIDRLLSDPDTLSVLAIKLAQRKTRPPLR